MKMKKKVFYFIVSIIVILLIIGVLVTILYNNKSKTEPSDADENLYDAESSPVTIVPFDAGANMYGFESSPYEADDSYLSYIEKDPLNEKLDSVSDANDLVNQIESIWIGIYGDRIKEQRPYQVFYDEKNAIWMVKGTLKENELGGVAYALIADGTWEVLAIWHDR